MLSCSVTLVVPVWIVFTSWVRLSDTCVIITAQLGSASEAELITFHRTIWKRMPALLSSHCNGCTWCCCDWPLQVDTLAGDQVRMNLHRLHAGKSDESVDALRAALEQLQIGFMSRQVSVKSVRLGQAVFTVVIFLEAVAESCAIDAKSCSCQAHRRCISRI
jgi:hypothetical protein